ncbi:MAG TPA: asparaginase [Candidatus Limnocylindrales bacterium]|nr:asparaginase [Candidatus Limnocylindrales bacterium]
MKRVALVFTGGTISMRPDAAAGGLRPAMSGAEILARVDGLDRIAEVEVVDWGLVPASHMSMATILELAALMGELLGRPDIDGVVLVQGTDTIEETAFAFDLLLPPDQPVVVTGAMRDTSAADYDGPRNILEAVGHAALDAAQDRSGVTVVLGGVAVGAEAVVKAHATAMDAFRRREGAAEHPWKRLPRLPGPREAVDDVHLIVATTGMHGTLVRGVAGGRPRGLVIAATGSGNTHPDLLAAATELMGSGTIVALTTRTAGGMVTPGYAFPGGGATWLRAGALMSRLDGLKTRVALALALAAGLGREEIAELIGPAAA